MQLSYWERKSFMSGYDTIIIGAGIVGISAALSLKDLEPNLKILVLERGFLPSGASTKNAGFACFGSVSELLEDFRYMGEEQTLNLVAKRYAGLAALRARTGDAEISFKQSGNYEVFKTGDDEIFETCASFIPILNQKIETITGEKNTFNISDANIPKFGFKDVSHLIFNKCEGKLDTGKMMHKLLTQEEARALISTLVLKFVKSMKKSIKLLFIFNRIWLLKQTKYLLLPMDLLLNCCRSWKFILHAIRFW